MNTASQNLTQHLGILRERMLHPTDYEKAIHYFLEEFAGDVNFISQSHPDEAPHLLAVIQHAVSQAAGQPVKLDAARVLHLADHRFYHGNAAAAGRVVLFFYFQEGDCGIMALIPGIKGGTDVVRFSIPSGLTDPRKN